MSGQQYVSTSRASEKSHSKTAWLDLAAALANWRRNLPLEMRVEGVTEWSVLNIWPLVLKARSYLLECVVYRTMRDSFLADSGDTSRAARMLKTSIFELDTLLDRIQLHGLVRYCPLYL